jgi:FeS assembly protein IscX
MKEDTYGILTDDLELCKRIFALLFIDRNCWEGIITTKDAKRREKRKNYEVRGLNMDETLTWDDSYAIARALMREHPGASLEEISLNLIFRWTIDLPGFADDPELANDAVLAAIYQEWFEEVNSI